MDIETVRLILDNLEDWTTFVEQRAQTLFRITHIQRSYGLDYRDTDFNNINFKYWVGDWTESVSFNKKYFLMPEEQAIAEYTQEYEDKLAKKREAEYMVQKAREQEKENRDKEEWERLKRKFQDT